MPTTPDAIRAAVERRFAQVARQPDAETASGCRFASMSAQRLATRR
jgi:hypothetical protein